MNTNSRNMKYLNISTIPDDWLQDILVHIDLAQQYRLTRCCRKWHKLFAQESTRQTVIVEGPLLAYSVGNAMHTDDHGVEHPSGPIMRRAMKTLENLDIRTVIFTGGMTTPVNSSRNDRHEECTFSWLVSNGWSAFSAFLFHVPPYDTRALGSLAANKIHVVFGHASGIFWSDVRELLGASRVRSLELIAVTLKMNVWWVVCDACTFFNESWSEDIWLSEQRNRIDHNNQFVSLRVDKYQIDDINRVVFHEFVRQTFPPPDPPDMTALRAVLDGLPESRLRGVVQHIITSTRLLQPLPEEGVPINLEDQHPVILWFLWAWNGVD